mgnify:CR=1 FL=1
MRAQVASPSSAAPEGAVTGAVTRAMLLPANSGPTIVASGSWSNNWADWDNSGGHNEWEDWNPSPPGG